MPKLSDLVVVAVIVALIVVLLILSKDIKVPPLF
jgi:hypothetical protein